MRAALLKCPWVCSWPSSCEYTCRYRLGEFMHLHRLLQPSILDFVTASAILHSATQKGYALQQMDILLRSEKYLLINTFPNGDAKETRKNSTPSGDNLLRRSLRRRLEHSPAISPAGSDQEHWPIFTAAYHVVSHKIFMHKIPAGTSPQKRNFW